MLARSGDEVQQQQQQHQQSSSTSKPPLQRLAHEDLIIIGAGFSGMGLGIQLKRKLNFGNFKIYERGPKLGGVWLWNSYPGAGCDVPAMAYSYSFCQNPDWSKVWVDQEEILEYMQNTANKFDMMKDIQFQTECTGAKWNKETSLWSVSFQDLTTGQAFEKTCKIFVPATGTLSIPNDCPLPKKELFHGPVFHSANWRHDVDLTDKQVILIGNGCTAAQIVPQIAGKVKHLTQFIRSPHHIDPIPLPSFKLSKLFRFLLRYVPGFQHLLRFIWICVMDLDFFQYYETTFGKFWRNSFHLFMNRRYNKLTAPAKYLDLLTPTFRYGSKRRVFDNGYLSTLHRSNVTLTKDPLQEITATGVLTSSGQEFEADVIIYATGFKLEAAQTPFPIIGVDGVSLKARWKMQGGQQAYMGGQIANCPNLIILMGANVYTGHHSAIYTAECQITHSLQYIKKLLEPSVRTIKVTQKAETAYNAWLDSQFKRLMWKEGDESGWYVDKNSGRNSITYPCYQTKFWWDTLFIRWADFEINK